MLGIHAERATSDWHSRAERVYHRALHVGIDEATPAPYVDRVVYSNWVFWVTAIFVVFAGYANYSNDFYFLLAFTPVLFSISLFSLWLNARRHYLAARLIFVSTILVAMVIESAARPDLDMPLYMLVIGVLGYSLFNGSEHGYGKCFAVLGGILFMALWGRHEPLLSLDPMFGHARPEAVFANRLIATGCLFSGVIGIGTAYARASRVVDLQRTKLFEHQRLSSLSTMACSVAHEINTPLMAIELHLDSLEYGLAAMPEPAGALADVEALGKLSRRIADMVRNFKLLSQHGDATSKLVTVDELITPFRERWVERIEPLRIAVAVELHDPGAVLSCHVAALSQALVHVLDNAIDATADQATGDRWIRLATRERDARLELSITDSGRIESEQVRERMFHAFFTTKPLGRGIGLGLSLSRTTIEQLGGRIYLDAASPTTRVVIELPLAELPRATA